MNGKEFVYWNGLLFVLGMIAVVITYMDYQDALLIYGWSMVSFLILLFCFDINNNKVKELM